MAKVTERVEEAKQLLEWVLLGAARVLLVRVVLARELLVVLVAAELLVLGRWCRHKSRSWNMRIASNDSAPCWNYTTAHMPEPSYRVRQLDGTIEEVAATAPCKFLCTTRSDTGRSDDLSNPHHSAVALPKGHPGAGRAERACAAGQAAAVSALLV